MAEPVKFWFDVMCPFAWATSRWIKEAEKVRDIEVQFVPMSLAILNDGNDDQDDDHKKVMEAAWGPARVFAKVADEEPNKVDALYTAMGTKVHVEENDHRQGFGAYDDIIAAALEEVGLDASYAEVANTDAVDEKLKAFHDEAIDKVGDDVGTPVVEMKGSAFFGPVITRIPTGEKAGALFDAAVGLAVDPYFFALKRTRTEMPEAQVGEKSGD